MRFAKTQTRVISLIISFGLMLLILTGCAGLTPKQTQTAFDLPSSVPSLSSPTKASLDDELDLKEVVVSPSPKFSLHLVNESSVHVLQQLAWMAEKELEIWPNQAPPISIRADNLTLNELLHKISIATGLQVIQQDQRIIARPDQLYWQTYVLDMLNLQRSKVDDLVTNLNIGQISISSATQNSSQSKMQVVSESHIWRSLSANLAQLLINEPLVSDIPFDQRVVTQPEAGLVKVLASYQQQQMIASWLDQLQQRTSRQVLIEAVVAEVALSEEFQTGIDWNLDGFKNRAAFASQTNERVFSASLGAFGLDIMLGLRWLENFGQVSVLSSPRVMALNNQPAMLKVVDNFVYFTIGVVRTTNQTMTEVSYGSNLNSVPVGLILNVVPMVTEQNQVLLNVRPSVTRIIGQVRDPNPDLAAAGIENFVPLIQEREMETVLRLANNETVIIGGLIEQRQDFQQQGLYGLARQPSALSRLFGVTRSGQAKTELVVLLRAQVITDPL